MKNRYCIVIWHQAGGRDNNSVYYLWADENENTYVFPSKQEAIKKWHDDNMGELHAGTVIDVTTGHNYWI